MVAILAAVLTDGLPAVEVACTQAMAECVRSSDVRPGINRHHPHTGCPDTAPHADRRLRQIRSTQKPMSMERTEVLDMMGALKFYGMKGAYDETPATAINRMHEPQRFVGDLLKAEISEKQAHSIRYQMTIAKLPLARDVDGFAFKETPINESLVRDLAGGNFVAQQRNVVLVGGAGKTHLAIAIARSCIRAGSRGRFFNTVDLVNRLEAEGRAGRQGRLDGIPPRLRHLAEGEICPASAIATTVAERPQSA